MSFFDGLPEWSKYKHLILEKYLHVWVSKLSSTNPVLAYVDGFAGEGTYRTGEEGSPVIAARKNDIGSMRAGNKKLLVMASETEPEAAARLRATLDQWNTPGDTRTFVESQPFHEILGTIAERTRDLPTFFFIDPFGNADLTPAKLSPLLQSTRRKSTEVLVRVDPYLFGRYAGWLKERQRSQRATRTAESFGRLLEQFDMKALAKELQAHQASDAMVAASLFDSYLSVFEQRFEYVQLIPIRAAYFRPPKYYLVHGTDHPQGCAHINDVVCVVEDDLFEKQISDDAGDQGVLDFAGDSLRPRATPVTLRAEIVEILKGGPHRLDQLRAKLAMRFGPDFRAKHHNQAIRDLIKSGVVRRVPPTGPMEEFVRLSLAT